MRATCKAGEVPCAAEYSTTYYDVTAGRCHVSSHGGEHTIRALTWEWPDEMDGKLSGSPFFFVFRGKGYAYLNCPPVPHERLAHRSRHVLVKTSRIFTFRRCLWWCLAGPFLNLVCCRYFLTPPACPDNSYPDLLTSTVDLYALKQNTLNRLNSHPK